MVLEKRKALNDYKNGIPISLDQLLGTLKQDSVAQEDVEWTLIRERDQLKKWSSEIGFIEWKDDGHFKELHKGIEGLAIGRSLILAPFNTQFTWQTTVIQEFHVREEGGWAFSTNNSQYVLFNKEQYSEKN